MQGKVLVMERIYYYFSLKKNRKNEFDKAMQLAQR